MTFRNITISGRIAVGSTTLFKGLNEVLAPKGWTFFSGGEFMRAYAVDHGLINKNNPSHHPATVYADEVDIKMDSEISRRLKEESKLVIESDLAGFMARDIPYVLRVLLHCNDALRVDRIVNRDGLTVEQAKAHIRTREEENNIKWKRLYGEHDFWSEKYYNLMIDTYENSPKETLNRVLEKLGISQ